MRKSRALTATLEAPLAALTFAGPAAAHPGHLVAVAGHSHWLAGAAIGAAVLIGAWAAIGDWRRPAKRPEEAAETDREADPEAEAQGQEG